MQARENWIAAIAALVAIFVVSVTIVALTYWSGDLFGPWTSAPPAVVEERGLAMPSMRQSESAADSAGASFRGSHGQNGSDAGTETIRMVPGALARRHAARDAE